MKLVINLKLDFQQDDEKAKPTKVVPYVRVRNGFILLGGSMCLVCRG